MRDRLLSCLGSTLVWYDFALYSFLGPVFATVFFPHEKHSYIFSLFVTYGFFSLSYVFRPLGGIIFGYIGDNYGRVVSLKLTSLLISLTTFMMTFLPTYSEIGKSAIFLLLLTRLLQGVFLGGELAGNFVYLYEMSLTWRYFWVSIGSFSGGAGILLASALSAFLYSFLNHSFMVQYGWRLAYFLAIPLGVIAFKCRSQMAESNDFSKVTLSKSTLFKIMQNNIFILKHSLGLTCLHATSFYFVFMFIPVFLIKIRGLTASAALIENSIFLATHLLLIPFFGFVTSKIGGLKFNLIVSLLFILTTIPIFYVISFGSKANIAAALIFLSVFTSINAAVVPTVMAELIPSKIRSTVMGLCLNIAFGFFGGTMPAFGLLLAKSHFGIMSPSYYLTFIAMITFTSSLSLLSKDQYEIRTISATR